MAQGKVEVVRLPARDTFQKRRDGRHRVLLALLQYRLFECLPSKSTVKTWPSPNSTRTFWSFADGRASPDLPSRSRPFENQSSFSFLSASVNQRARWPAWTARRPNPRGRRAKQFGEGVVLVVVIARQQFIHEVLEGLGSSLTSSSFAFCAASSFGPCRRGRGFDGVGFEQLLQKLVQRRLVRLLRPAARLLLI